MDSDFADCKDMCCSTKENIFVVAGGPVLWESKRQETVALSTVKAEYMSFSRAMTQALWISKTVQSGSGVTQSGRELTTKVGEQPWPQLVYCALIFCCMCGCIFQGD